MRSVLEIMFHDLISLEHIISGKPQNKIGFFVFTKVDPHHMKRLKGCGFMYAQSETH